ncbi:MULTISPECIES: hypothetical protein [unclassified Virgibacillus]|uniref:hypothetical protein n=1 Tax=unclassified Virgibacillus TaxID=2620237 RepID=UPI00090C3957|nr:MULTISPECIES: hypothetical protein [unclassified Virgibacillus]API93495.1 hypothetical protein BKP57_17780 [Virgibacillus sp. 6R]MBS7430119.1 hypothetical protein [Virgibacillus sp. 19R1-5]
MLYNVYIHKASDSKRSVYAYFMQNASTGSYSEHVIVKKIKRKQAQTSDRENDFKAFQAIIRHTAKQTDVHKANFIFVKNMTEFLFELVGAEETEHTYLRDSANWLLQRFVSYNLEGSNGEEHQAVAVIDNGMQELERHKSVLYRFQRLIKKLKGEDLTYE